MLNKSNALKIIKLALGSSLATFIAGLLNLEYAMFAGIITLLTVKNTKKETLKVALGKVYGFLLCTLFSYLCFNTLGFNLVSFSVYTFIIITFCFILDIQYVMAMCLVISSHYLLQGNVSFDMIINESLLFTIGASMGVIMNMYIPSNIDKIYNGQLKLQEEIRVILLDISNLIKSPTEGTEYDKDLHNLNNLIDKSVSQTYENINNNLLSDTRFFLNHIESIKRQRDILETLYSYVYTLNSTPSQGYIISDFIFKMANTTLDFNNVSKLLKELEFLTSDIKNQPLPLNRDEFENRAILFLCLVELRIFLSTYLGQNGCSV
ncbi:aromatic acid exporter family protein [Romboutsia sp.]|uniref:aromatic acid exporter family protein n=1 Tax=Romboutsia sp. TaxID=1965302 RepID=UPI003F30807E